MDLMYSQMDDAELVIECQRGDKQAIEYLVKKHIRSVHALLYQLAPDWNDISDLAQEVFIRVYRGIHSLRNPKTFRSWLNQIVVNLFYDELRKRPRRLHTVSIDAPIEYDGGDSDLVRDIPDPSLKPDEISLVQELDQVIKRAMAGLPEQFRTAIVLRELHGLSYEEIAESIGCELGTVKSRIARARGRLQEVLSPYLEKKRKRAVNEFNGQ
ncbi:MAG: sigma-70 family RNA polymerase sigma factor [Candidatus Melainabacteria bacterium]|nr:sigma-70 family RNA polymerase sigma factor [Candidatus Melainabacteria bacterium]MBI3309685.1 sigma-70 family RNA polymerase sigma factor [Candidatus Melainabacteria bacterium]